MVPWELFAEQRAASDKHPEAARLWLPEMSGRVCEASEVLRRSRQEAEGERVQTEGSRSGRRVCGPSADSPPGRATLEWYRLNHLCCAPSAL